MLFVERARAAEPSFALTDDNAPAVAEICVRLDGIPLAIELAAARVSVLTPAGIATNLDDRFDLLRGGRGGPARHQTLRALVEWSYDTLTDPNGDSSPACRCSATASTWRPPSTSPGRTHPRRRERTVVLLSDLVDRSLIQVRHDSDARYALLETIRAFAGQRLAETGEEVRDAPSSSEWALVIAGTADEQLRGAEWRQGASRLAAERGNLRVGARLGPRRWGALERAGNWPRDLARWWFVSGHYTEGRQFLTRALAGADDEPLGTRARLHLGAGWCAYHLGDSDDAEALARQGLELAEAAGDDLLEAWARVLLAGLAWSAGNGDRVRDLLAGAAEWSEAPAAAPLAARAAVLLSNVSFVAGDLRDARRLGELAVAHARAAPGTENLALAFICSAHPALVAGDLDTAATLIDDALATARAAGDRFAETIGWYQRAWLWSVRGDADAAEVEAGRCWSVGRAGAVRLVDALAPVADAAAALAARAAGRRPARHSGGPSPAVAPWASSPSCRAGSPTGPASPLTSATTELAEDLIAEATSASSASRRRSDGGNGRCGDGHPLLAAR